MKCKTLIIVLFYTAVVKAQNVGIGTATPGFPLNFSNAIGDKISLYGNTGNHYGFGIQGGLLQMYSDAAAANIGFGFGTSSAFTERMRIINAGGDGLDLKGRIILRNGTAPLDLNYGSGIWMYKADNSAMLGFMGVQNNQNLGFYGGPAGWGFCYDAINSRVGIGGNSTPNAPLSFPPLIGKKITLYPGATGDVGFGVAGNRLQIYSDNPNADVAIGYDAAGVFNERFAVKPNGALAVNGSMGVAGQVIKSNGGSSAASWVSPTNELYNNTLRIDATGSILVNNAGGPQYLPGLDYTFSVAGNAKVLVSFNIPAWAPSCAFCGNSQIGISTELDGDTKYSNGYYIGNDQLPQTLSATVILLVTGGTHTVKLRGSVSGPSVYLSTSASTFNHNEMIVQIISQ